MDSRSGEVSSSGLSFEVPVTNESNASPYRPLPVMSTPQMTTLRSVGYNEDAGENKVPQL